MVFVGSCDWSVRLATLRLVASRLRDCASANGIAQMARSKSRMSALRRRCALTEGLICFFTSRVHVHTSSGNTLLARNAKLRQDLFENLRNFSRGRWLRLFVLKKLKLNGTVLPLNEEEEGLLPPALPEVPAYKK